MADSDDTFRARAAQRFPGMAGTEPGDVVGGYELLREIGRGGMAEVWLARRERSIAGKFVAVKMVLAQHVGNERYSRMFLSEAEVSAPLSHSNIVQVFDEGEDRGRSYLVMEWVDGADLARLLPSMAELRVRDPYLRLRLAAYIVGQVLHGLSYAHRVTSHRGESLGIVHRDISPQNVLVSVSGDVKVADFGIAHRMIEETSGINVKGKLRYMAPEHLQGRSHEPTVDLYAVGALLQELLDGQRFRHTAEDQVALYHQVMVGVVPELSSGDVPEELDAVRRALLDPDAARRPQTADAAVLMLKRWSGYSEMRVELGMLCGLAIGVVRPRTGPIIAAGASTVAPRSTQQPASPVFAPPAHAEPDAPAAPWGMVPSRPADRSGAAVGYEPTAMLADHEQHASLRAKSEPTVDFSSSTDVPVRAPGVPVPAAVDRRDLEPTHSSVAAQQWTPSASALASVETTSTGTGVGMLEPRPRAAPLLWVGLGAVVLATLGGGATAMYLSQREPHEPAQLAVAAKPEARERVVEPELEAPEVELSPVVVAEPPAPAPEPSEQAAVDAAPAQPEPAAQPAPGEPTPPVVAPVSSTPSAAKPSGRPTKSSKPAKAPEAPPGPEVTLHVRLDGGMTGAELKLGRRVIAVRPRFDGRIAAGKYAAQYRLESGAAWKPAGTITIGDAGEWKLLLGPTGARVNKL